MQPHWIARRRKHPRPSFPKANHVETTLAERTLRIERKTFVIAVKENHLGRFIRVVELGKLTRSAIVIPESGWHEFARGLSAMLVRHRGQKETALNRALKSFLPRPPLQANPG